MPVTLDRQDADGKFSFIARGVTNADGRVADLATREQIPAGVYRLTFDTDAYFRGHKTASFYPAVVVLFRIADAAQHHHVPLLLSPYGYSTYRGS